MAEKTQHLVEPGLDIKCFQDLLLFCRLEFQKPRDEIRQCRRCAGAFNGCCKFRRCLRHEFERFCGLFLQAVRARLDIAR